MEGTRRTDDDKETTVLFTLSCSCYSVEKGTLAHCLSFFHSQGHGQTAPTVILKAVFLYLFPRRCFTSAIINGK